jgi:REP element-mobilizing transposase RayT
MKRKNQRFLPGFQFSNATNVFGGEHSIGKRKTQRPISIKKPMHVVMRASKARGIYSLRGSKNFSMVNHTIRIFAKRFGVKIYRYSINSNHIHIALRSQTRKGFQNYLRATAGVIGLKVLDSVKRRRISQRLAIDMAWPNSRGKRKFWDLLAFSRIVEWGGAYKILLNYVLQNQLEAEGTIAYRPRNHRHQEYG